MAVTFPSKLLRQR